MPKKEPEDRSDQRDGMVNVWDLHRHKWMRVHTVDAREMIAVGSASLAEPEAKPKAPSAPASAPKP